jgi:hypothetical protein
LKLAIEEAAKPPASMNTVLQLGGNPPASPAIRLALSAKQSYRRRAN